MPKLDRQVGCEVSGIVPLTHAAGLVRTLDRVSGISVKPLLLQHEGGQGHQGRHHAASVRDRRWRQWSSGGIWYLLANVQSLCV